MTDHTFGAGLIGTAHAHALGHMEAVRASKNWELIPVAKPSPTLSAQARENPRRQGVPWTTVDALLSDSRVQMICVETDPLESLPYSLHTIEAGKHVKIDKPPGVDCATLRKIFDQAERCHLLVQMGFRSFGAHTQRTAAAPLAKAATFYSRNSDSGNRPATAAQTDTPGRSSSLAKRASKLSQVPRVVFHPPGIQHLGAT